MKSRKILLISSSVVFGGGYLDYAESEIRDHLDHIRTILFIPYALQDYESYYTKVRLRFEAMSCRLDAIHHSSNAQEAVGKAEAIFIGGGNTFRLLKTLQAQDLLPLIRSRVNEGEMSYMGSSAGTNVACPTVRTTNDMPIVEPESLTALGLIPFQINPHYVDPDPGSRHMGETREERIREFLEENDLPVVGLREGSMIRIQGARMTLKGIVGARIFRKGIDAVEVEPGADLTELSFTQSRKGARS